MAERQSNFELLRIVAMLLVLLVHADFWSIGEPSLFDFKNNPSDAISRVFFQSLSIACVDIFVLISGWFGIKPDKKGLLKFLFQCFFFLIGIYAVSLLLGNSKLCIEGIKECLFATEQNWFIKAYLLLFIISPILNSFIEYSNKHVFKIVLLAFFFFELLYGWLFSKAGTQFQGGYSTISFIGLYLLARYIRIYQPSFTRKSKKYDVSIILSCVLGVTAIYATPPYLFEKQIVIGSKLLSYISPSTILLSTHAILLFSKISFNSKIVNWFAASSFAAYLLHTNPNTRNLYQKIFITLHENVSTFNFWVITFGIIAIVFLLAVLIDKIRISLWEWFWTKINLSLSKKEFK